MDISNLVSQESKVKIVTARLTQFAEELYQYQLNLKTSEAMGIPDQIESTKKSIAALEIAIRIHEQELAEITK
jgi:hypothetical protein